MANLDSMVDIGAWEGEGYEIVVDSPNETWMTAIKNFTPTATLEGLTSLQKHPNSDEVFVLMQGQAVLLIAEGEDEITAIHEIPMQPYTVYNVRRNVWHGSLMAEDAILLIAENSDTVSVDKELTTEQKAGLRGLD